MIGKKLSPMLIAIEDTLCEFEESHGKKSEYTREGFRAISKIFMSAMMDKLWELQEKENLAMPDRIKMVEKLGKTMRQIIKTYTDIDTHELFNDKK